jgi:hypothetical protein
VRGDLAWVVCVERLTSDATEDMKVLISTSTP